MRLQIAALPPKTVGAITHADHILVFDNIRDEAPPDVWLDWLKKKTGAVAVLCSREPIDVANPLELPADIVEQLRSTLRERIDGAASEADGSNT